MNKIKLLLKKWWPLLAVMVILGAVALRGAYYYMDRPAGDGSKKMEFVVKNGWGAYAVTRNLYKKDLISSRTAFKVVLFVTGKKHSFKRGIYTLHDGMSPSKIIDILSSGRTKTRTLTIPEGYLNRQIAGVFVKKKFFTSRGEFLRYASLPSVLKKYNIPAKTSEGYLFPDTYSIPVGYPKEKIVEHMIEHFLEKTSVIKGFPEDPDKRHKIVTMASIVEREALKKEERPLIASVFYNRLKKNQYLGSCATIQYILKRPRKKLYYSDLEIDSPYNTYRRKGLPPGPISNPGLSALKAATNPADTEYLYFVVKGDGTHKFSRTFNEHVRAKRKFLGSDD